ncbi:MAG: SdpI family protein [Erysipelotrichaceae bacterium]|nr:SdpI family protein [Erysipelotrichaceae bacterium]
MMNKKLVVITSIIILLPILVSLCFWNQLPEQVPIHWNIHGEIDGYASRFVAVIVLPLVLFVLHFVCAFATMMDPKHKNISDKIWMLILSICPVLSILLMYMMVGSALGMEIDVNAILPVFLGVMFVVIGNYLPKCKQSYTVGIKIPWTLNSEENWNKTHRFAGPCWVIGGIIVMFTGLFENEILIMVIALIMVFAPIIYSYMYYVKYEKEE